MVRVARSAAPAGDGADPARQRRQLVADLCRLLGSRINPGSNGDPIIPRQLPRLSPRMRQTLERLLAGDSEKQIAARLCLSQPTVHQYVTALHRHFGVSSRGELLAHFIVCPTLMPEN